MVVNDITKYLLFPKLNKQAVLRGKESAQNTV